MSAYHTCMSPRGALPDPHQSLAASHTHLFSLCLRQEAVDLRVPSHHPSLRRTLAPATHVCHHIAAEKTIDTSDQDGGRNILICLCVCVLCTKRGRPFFAGRCGGGGWGRGKKTPSHEICFSFSALAFPGYHATKERCLWGKKRFHRQTAIPNTPLPSPKIHQGTHPAIHPPMVVMRRRLQSCVLLLLMLMM